MKFKFVLCLIMITTFLGGVRDGDNMADSSIDFIRIARMFLLFFVFSYLVLSVNFRKRIAINGFSLYYFLVVYFAITAIWAPSKLFLFWKLFEVLVLLLFFLYISQKMLIEDVFSLYGTFFKYLGYAVIGVLITGLMFFDVGFEPLSGSVINYKLHGSIYSMNSNDLGFWSGLLLTFSILKKDHYTNNRFYINAFLYGSILIFSQARTFLAVSFLVIGFHYGFRKSILTSIIFSILISIIWFFYSDNLFMLFTRGDLAQLESLHGRTYYWELGIEYFLKNPILGHGFYTGHRFLSDIYPESHFSSMTFDSTWVDILVDTGIVGVSIFLLFIFNLLRKMNKINDPVKIELKVGFLFLIIRSLTGPSFETFNLFLIYLLMLTFVTNIIVAKHG